uniref:Uncharacterized protein n=1 Tax=Rhizophora mucronata TaxID=61149 RepID=A0A2P2PTD8_RHIMU
MCTLIGEQLIDSSGLKCTKEELKD